jgi:hypothetical protein
MDGITLIVTLIALTLVFSLKRLARLWPASPVHPSTFHKALAVHIADTTRSAGRNLSA